MPIRSIQALLLAGAGLLLATLPDGPVPDIFWRLHFGGGQFLCGAAFGVGIGLYYAQRGDA